MFNDLHSICFNIMYIISRIVSTLRSAVIVCKRLKCTSIITVRCSNALKGVSRLKGVLSSQTFYNADEFFAFDWKTALLVNWPWRWDGNTIGMWKETWVTDLDLDFLWLCVKCCEWISKFINTDNYVSNNYVKFVEAIQS